MGSAGGWPGSTVDAADGGRKQRQNPSENLTDGFTWVRQLTACLPLASLVNVHVF